MTQNTQDFTRILNEINSKIDYMSSNNDRQSIDVLLNKVKTLEQTFNDNMLNFNFEKQSVFDNIQKEITNVIEKSSILKELFPQQENEKLEKVENTINANLSRVHSELSDTIKEDFNNVAQGIGALYSKIELLKNKIDNTEDLEGIRNEINSIGNKMIEIRDELKQNSGANLSSIIENIGTVNAEIKNSNDNLNEFKENIAENLTNYLASIKELFVSFSDEMHAHQESLSSDVFNKKLQELEVLSKDINELNENLDNKEENYKNILDEKVAELHNYLKSLEDIMSSSNISIGNSIAEITEIKNYIANTAIKLDDIYNNLSQEFTTGAMKIDELKDIVSNRFSSVDSKLYSLEDNLVKELGGKISLMEQIKDDIGTSVNTNFNEIKTILECMRASVSQNAGNLSDKLDSANEKSSSDIENILNKVTEISDKTVIYATEAKSLTENKIAEIQNYLSNLERILSSTSINLDGSLGEITEIKEYIANTSLKLDDIRANVFGNLEKGNENIEDIKNIFSQRLEAINSKLYTMEDNLAKEIAGKISEFEQTKDESNVTVNNNLNELKTIVECLRASVSQSASNLNENISEFRNSFDDKIAALTYKTEENKINSVELKTILNSLSEQIEKNHGDLSQVLSNTSFGRDDISARIEDVKNHISAIKLAIADLNTENSDKLTEKLFAIESKLYDSTETYEQNLSNLQGKIAEYIKNVELISEETNTKLENSATEFIDIKNNLNEIQDKLNYLNSDQKSFLEENLSSIVEKLGEVTDNLTNHRDEIKTDIKDVMKENITFVDKGLQYLTMTLDEIKAKQSENSDEITNTISSRLVDIKQEIELLNTDVNEAFNVKSDSIIKEFEPLKSAILDFTSFDFNEIITEIKNQIEISYLNLLQELNKNLIENHDTYINIENTYKDVVSRCASLQECIDDFTRNNLELINSTIAGLDLNVRSSLEKSDHFFSEWKSVSAELAKKLTESNSEVERSLVNILAELQKTIDEKVNAGSNELKDFLAVMLNDEDLILTLEGLNDDVLTQIETVKASLESQNRKIESSVENINKDVNNKLEEIHLYMAAKPDEDEQLTKFANMLKNALSDAQTTIINKFESPLKELESNLAGKLEKHHKDIQSSIIESLEAPLNKLETNLAEKFEAPLTRLEVNIVDKFEAPIKELETNIVSKLETPIKEVQSSILNNLEEPLTRLETNIVDKFEAPLQNVQNTITDKLEQPLKEVIETDNRISDMLEALHSKVDILAMADDSEIRDEISDVKDLIFEQRKCFEELDNDKKAQEIENYLNNLLTEINKIDLEKNAQDIKDSVMSAILSVTDQVSFVEETEEIKDFVEEKTNAINETLLDVKKQLHSIASSNSDMDFYSYTLQDVESDLAKLRLAMNELSSSNSLDEVGVISSNINRIAKSIEDLRSTLTVEQNDEMHGDFDKLNEDILSISARTNKLLLNSDESYRIISDSMEEFNRRTHSLQEQLDAINSKNLENKLSQIEKKVNATMSSSKVLENVMMYLGEWMDGTTELVNSIYDKSSKTTSIQQAIDELKSNVPEKQELLNIIEDKFEEQQSRIDRLEQKLEKVITLMEEREADTTQNKIEKIEKQLAKLSSNIEKLTSYVDE